MIVNRVQPFYRNMLIELVMKGLRWPFVYRSKGM